MSSRSIIIITIGILCLTERAFSGENVTAKLPKENHRKKWVSTVILEHISDYRITSNENPQCTRHFDIYREHLENFTFWAVQMFDSSALVPGGFLVGDRYKLGNFEECINTLVPKELGFSAQYCLPAFKFRQLHFQKSPHSPNKWERPVWDQIQASKDDRTKVLKDVFNLAFCIPSTCSSKDLQLSLQDLLEGPMRDAAYDLKVFVDDLHCTTNESPEESKSSSIMRFLIIVLTCILVFCSAVDILLAAARENYDIRNTSLANAKGIEKLILPFSFFRHFRALITPSTSPDDYLVLHGFKFILMIGIIVAHRSFLNCYERAAIVNWNYFENRIQKFSVFYTAMPFPDLFFCISGFVLALGLIKQLEKNKFSAISHVLNRLLRVLPPYAFVLAYTILVLPNLGTGPLWKAFIEPEVEHCRRDWWLNLLFVNNYINGGSWCLISSHYIAADMHFFIVGSIIVYLCWRWKSYRNVILGASFLTSILLPFYTDFNNNYDGLIKLYPQTLLYPRNVEEIKDLYMKSHCRFGGYITGIVGAFLLKDLQKEGHRFSKNMSWAGVLLGVSIIGAISYARHLLHLPTTPYSVIQHSLYAGTHTQLLSVGLMMIVIIHITTGFGDLNPLFLAYNFAVPFGRLSYWACLINIPLIMYLVGSLKTPTHMTHEGLMFAGHHWGDVALTYFLSIYCYLIIDVPISYIRPRVLKYATNIFQSPIKKNYDVSDHRKRG